MTADEALRRIEDSGLRLHHLFQTSDKTWHASVFKPKDASSFQERQGDTPAKAINDAVDAVVAAEKAKTAGVFD